MDQEKLIELAWLARENAYTPYSHFKVGACVALKDGTLEAKVVSKEIKND